MDDITRSPKGRSGSSTGSEPVAMTTLSARIVWVPVSVATSTVLPSTNLAQPRIDFTPAFFSSPPTPMFSRSTMPSFQAMVLAKSIFGADADRPKGVLPAAASSSLWNSSAAWISALDGIQPTLRQVPPSGAPSTMTVSRPSWPARMAQT